MPQFDQVGSRFPGEFVRGLLTWLGGALVARGVISEGMIEPIVGAVSTLIGIGWSLIARRRE
jgi:hypothetical protein